MKLSTLFAFCAVCTIILATWAPCFVKGERQLEVINGSARNLAILAIAWALLFVGLVIKEKALK